MRAYVYFCRYCSWIKITRNTVGSNGDNSFSHPAVDCSYYGHQLELDELHRGGSYTGTWGTQQSFIRPPPSPHTSSKPLTFYIPLLTEKIPLSYTSRIKLYTFRITFIENGNHFIYLLASCFERF